MKGCRSPSEPTAVSTIRFPVATVSVTRNDSERGDSVSSGCERNLRTWLPPQVAKKGQTDHGNQDPPAPSTQLPARVNRSLLGQLLLDELIIIEVIVRTVSGGDARSQTSASCDQPVSASEPHSRHAA